MKRIIQATVAIAFGILTGSQASAELQPRSGGTLFQQLEELFAQGTEPVNADIVGWRTGRCYRAQTPTMPENSLLAGWTLAGPNHGPIAPHDEYLVTIPVHWQNGAAGWFDQLTPEVEVSVDNFIQSQRGGLAITFADGGSLYGSYRQNTSSPWVMRKNGDYVVAEMIQNGYVSQMCYYFNLIRQ